MENSLNLELKVYVKNFIKNNQKKKKNPAAFCSQNYTNAHLSGGNLSLIQVVFSVTSSQSLLLWLWVSERTQFTQEAVSTGSFKGLFPRK